MELPQEDGAGTDEEETEEKAFTVIRETVRKKPRSIKKMLRSVFLVLLGAVLFGIVAAFVFSRFAPVFLPSIREPVAFDPDPTPTPAAGTAIGAATSGTSVAELTGGDSGETVSAGTGAVSQPGEHEPEGSDGGNAEPQDGQGDTENSGPSENSGADPAAQGDPTPTPTPLPTPSPTPDPQKESEERIHQNKLLYADLRRIAAEPSRSIVTVTGISTTEDWFNVTDEDRRSACGVIVADNGLEYLILTDETAILDSSRILVTLYGGTITECRHVKTDPSTGLAIVSVDKRSIAAAIRAELRIASLGNSYNAGIGDPIIAAGAPMGYSNSVVFGQITSLASKAAVFDGAYSLLMTNIQGASGGSGALLNMDGQVIGFIMQRYVTASGGNVIAALAISQLKPLIEILSNDRDIAYFGIKGETVTQELSDSFEMPSGVYITEVDTDSPAYNAGIQRGDILTRIGEHDISDMTAFRNVLNNGMAGTEQIVTIQRLGAGGYVELNLESMIGIV